MPSLLSNVRLSFLSFALGKAAAAAANIALFRSLGPAQMGDYTAALGFAGVFSVLAELGLSAYLTREVSRHPEKASTLFSQALLVQGIQVLIAALVLGGFLWRGGSDAISPALVGLGFAWVALINLSSPFSACLQGLEEFGSTSRVSSLASVLNAAGLWLVLLFAPSVAAALASLVLTGILGLGMWVRAASKKGLHFEMPRPFQPFKFWKETLPFASVSGLNQLYLRMDVVLLTLLSGSLAVGYYGAGVRVSDLLAAVLGSLIGPLYPRLASSTTDPSHGGLRLELSRATRYMTALSLPLGIGGTVMAASLMPWLFGADFAPAGAAFAWLVWVPALMGVNAGLLLALSAVGALGAMNLIFVVALGLNLSLNRIFIPSQGVVACAWIWVLCEVLILAVCLALLALRHRVALSARAMLWPSLPAALGMGILLHFLPMAEGWHCVPRVLEGALVYAGLLWVLGFFGPEEKEHLGRALGFKS